MKLCECGCGNAAPIAKQTDRSRGHIKGEPIRFIRFHQRRPLEARFWEKVEKAGPDDCWLWTGQLNKDGYGVLRAGKVDGYRTQGAHRISFQLAGGTIPEGKSVCHTCDNPGCVNPNHLWVGSNQDNVDDSVRKGRWTRGEKSGMAKLTDKDVREMRERYPAESYEAIARAFRVSKKTARSAIIGETWKHVEGARP